MSVPVLTFHFALGRCSHRKPNELMARYSANHPNRTLTLHKETCSEVAKAAVSPCGCGSTSTQGNSKWFCEEHVTIEGITDFMGGRFWAMLLCTKCYGDG